MAYFKNAKPAFEAMDIKRSARYAKELPRWVDDYMDGYMAVLYPDYHGATELWTVLAQEFDTPAHMTAVFRKHPDLFKALLGLALE